MTIGLPCWFFHYDMVDVEDGSEGDHDGGEDDGNDDGDGDGDVG